MSNKTYNEKELFAFDELPLFITDEFLCGIYVDSIHRKRGFFYVICEEDNYYLKYSLVSSKDFLELANDVESNKEVPLCNIIRREEFKDNYIKKKQNIVLINNKNYINEFLQKIKNDDISKYKEDQGLDGYTTILKIDGMKEIFKTWCVSSDTRYYYIIDFINYIYNLADIEEEYQIVKN